MTNWPVTNTRIWDFSPLALFCSRYAWTAWHDDDATKCNRFHEIRKENWFVLVMIIAMHVACMHVFSILCKCIVWLWREGGGCNFTEKRWVQSFSNHYIVCMHASELLGIWNNAGRIHSMDHLMNSWHDEDDSLTDWLTEWQTSDKTVQWECMKWWHTASSKQQPATLVFGFGF